MRATGPGWLAAAEAGRGWTAFLTRASLERTMPDVLGAEERAVEPWAGLTHSHCHVQAFRRQIPIPDSGTAQRPVVLVVAEAVVLLQNYELAYYLMAEPLTFRRATISSGRFADFCGKRGMIWSQLATRF